MSNNIIRVFNFLAFLLLMIFTQHTILAQEKVVLKEIQNELRLSLKNDILDIWYPRVIDTVYGGYLSNFDSKWNKSDIQPKMLVSQARHIWTLSKVSEFLDDEKYKKYAKQGYDFLVNRMWDYKHDGFFHLRDRKGES